MCGNKHLLKRQVSGKLLSMKLVIGSLLFVFFSMLAEDALFAHAGAEDLSPCAQDNHMQNPQNHENDSSNSVPHRDICHFGHCSFLLTEPLLEAPLTSIPKISFTPYVFSFAARWLEPSFRPPIA